jgi:hypothetical protein
LGMLPSGVRVQTLNCSFIHVKCSFIKLKNKYSSVCHLRVVSRQMAQSGLADQISVSVSSKRCGSSSCLQLMQQSLGAEQGYVEKITSFYCFCKSKCYITSRTPCKASIALSCLRTLFRTASLNLPQVLDLCHSCQCVSLHSSSFTDLTSCVSCQVLSP